MIVVTAHVAKTEKVQMKAKRDVLAFDRWDATALRVVLWLIVATGIGANVVQPIVTWVQGDSLSVSYPGKITVPELDRVGTAYGSGVYDVVVDDPTLWQRVTDLAPGVLMALLILGVVVLLQRVLQRIVAGEPFAPGQVTRLRLVAFLLGLGMPIVLAIEFVAGGVLLGSVDLGDMDLIAEVDVPWLMLAAGMVVALFAEAFKSGAGLRDDVSGLV